MATFTKLVLILALSFRFSHSSPSSVRLHNAAEEGMTMPVVGIGTGGYGPPGETWDDASAEKAITQWLSVGGRRIDTSLDYGDQVSTGTHGLLFNFRGTVFDFILD